MIGRAVDVSTSDAAAGTRVSGAGMRHAMGNALRVFALLVSVLALVLARWNAPLTALLVLVGIALLTLYAVDRKTGRFGLWAAYMVGFVLFALLRTRADDLGLPIRTSYAVQADEWLFGGALPQHWLQQRLYHPGSALAIFGVVVIFSYYLVPHLVALGLWRSGLDEFKRYALAVLITVYAGLAISAVLPTAPPWLAHRFADAPRVDRIEALVLHWNPETIGRTSAPGTNPVAAMPSLHFAVTALILVALWRRRSLRYVALAYLAAMGFVLVFMGEHYVVDLLVGAAIAAMAWLAASRLVRPRTVAAGDAAIPAIPAPASPVLSATSEDRR